MSRWKYVGSYDAVELVGVGTVANGHTIDVPDDLDAGLADQPDNWKPVTKEKDR